VEANEQGRIVLEFMARRGMKVTDSAPVDEIMDFGIDNGLSLSEIEGALVHASAKDWILLVGQRVHLSQAGYRLIGSANDN
jgi:hypothetical protein